jgi:hypothetical protein
MVEAREVTDRWVDLIEGTEIGCEDVFTEREVRNLD